MRRTLAALAVALGLAIAVSTSNAQTSPPSPPAASQLCGVTALSVTTSSARIAFPTTSASCGTVTLKNAGTVDMFVAIGSSSVVADTSGTALTSVFLAAGDSLPVWTNGTYIAAITATGSTTLRVYKGNGPLAIKSNGGNGGGGGTGCVPSGGTAATNVIVYGTLGACAPDILANLSNGSLTLGAPGTLGALIMGNTGTGLLTLEPQAGALGSVTVLVPAANDTLVNLSGIQTLSNKTFVAPALGTPLSGNAANLTGLPVSGISGLGTNVGSALGNTLNAANGLVSQAAVLTANLPLIGGGSGTGINVGARSGNTTTFGTTSGALTSGNCLKSDASGNIVDAAAACGGGGGGNVSNVGTPTNGQIGQWTGATTLQGITLVPVASGGTNLASGTSGGVLGYTAGGTLASSVALTANALVLGGGAGATPTPLSSLGTTSTLLHGNAAGAPTFGAVALSSEISGFGTGVAGALGTAIGAAGAPVLFNGAGGTPSSLTLTSASGLPIAGLTGLGTGVGTGLAQNINATSGFLTQTATLTANLPVIGGGSGTGVAVGTRSGNTTAFVTTTGTQTSGDCVKIDASGNHIANGSACPTGTVTTTGSPASGNLSKFSGATSVTNADLIGDVTTAGGVTTTLAAGSASNLNSGTLAAARGGAGTINGVLKGNGSGVVSAGACADLSNGATGCSTATGTSGATLPLMNGTNTWSGTQTFGSVVGGVNAQTGTTYTLQASDCGQTVKVTNGSAITVTTFQAAVVGCIIAIVQGGAGQITFANGGSATLVSAHSYTKTFNGAGATVTLEVLANAGSAAVFTLTGDGA